MVLELDLMEKFLQCVYIQGIQVNQEKINGKILEWLVARPLGLRTGEAVLQLRRVLAFQGLPTIVEDVWLPGSPFKGLTADRLAAYRGPMYALFETEFGVRMVRAEEKIRAVAADATAANLLAVRQGEALLSVERVAYTYNDVPMELRRGLYRTDTHYYKNELN